jgi:hypothetical protein
VSGEYDIVTRLRLAGCCGPRMKPCARCVAEKVAAEEIERLRAVLSAIDAEHCSTEEVEGFSGTFCAVCDDWWPCQTHRLLHPEGGPS